MFKQDTFLLEVYVGGSYKIANASSNLLEETLNQSGKFVEIL